MPATPISFASVIGGIADFDKGSEQLNSAAFIRHVDFRTNHRRLTLLTKAAKESVSVVTDLPLWGERVSDTIYIYGDSGNIYTRTLAGTVTLIHNVPNSSGNGLKYYGEDGFLYYTTDTVIGRYGLISGTPAFVDDFLGAQGGNPTNTFSLDLESGSSQYATAADHASISVTGDLALEAYIKPESLPTENNEMVIISKWNENGNERSYKWSLANAPSGGTVKLLVVAGAGGGGGAENPHPGAGGGAGGYIADDTYALEPGEYAVTVGSGGAGGAGSTVSVNGTSGGDSVFNDQTAVGGGGGGRSHDAGSNGGSGGGGGSFGSQAGGTGTAGQGNDGAAGISASQSSGGGGGAGGAGSNPGGGGAGGGGAGTANSISGASITYAKGGGGASESNSEESPSEIGSGGSGGQGNQDEAGQAGKDGTVVISYVTDDFGTCTGGTITTDGANTVHTFTSSGTFTLVGTGTVYRSRLMISSNGTDEETYDTFLSQIEVDEWTHLSVTLDVSASLATFYQNAQNIGTDTEAFTSINDSTALLAIGASFDGAGAAENFFDGLVDENRIFSDIRTATEILLNKDRELLGTDPNLEAYYQQDNALTDDSPNSNTLTIVNAPVYSVDVPFSGATTRLDIDQKDESTGATYAIPTSVSETATNRQSFVPAKDPQKSISVFVGAKGTGTWTCTVHDAQNRLIATASISTGDVPASGELEFTFSTPWTPVVGATYHFHITVSAGTSTLVAGGANDLEQGQFFSYYQFLVTDTNYHPIEQIVNLLTIGNGRYVASWNATTYNPHRLTFPSGWSVRCIGLWREYIAYGCVKGTSIESYDQGIIFFWDGTSDTYNFYINIPQGGVNALLGDQGTLHIIAGYKGDILEYNGGDKARKVKRLPNLEVGKQLEVAPGAITMWQTLLRIGAGITDSSVFEQGVYTWGALNERHPDSLSFDYATSTQNTQASNIKIGMILPVEKKLLIGWKDDTLFGLDAVDPAGTSYASGSIEYLIRDEGGIYKEKTLDLIKANFEALASGESVTLKYRVDRASSFTTLKTTSTVGDVELRENVSDARHKEYQIRLDFAATGTTSPAILGVTAGEDILAEEKLL